MTILSEGIPCFVTYTGTNGQFAMICPCSQKMFLYGVIGVFSASLDTISYMLLNTRLQVPNLAANFISVNIGICVSFFLNTYFNFRKADELKKRIIRFFSIGYLGLLISSLIMWTGVEYLMLTKLYVKVFSIFVVAAIQYLLNKFITFRE